jgi:hypothetical protein
MMPRPPCLGVTGHRLIPLGQRPALTAQLDALFRGCARPGLLLTSLAEGADCLAARRALAAGWSLEAVLPFPAEEYEADFRKPVTPGVSADANLAEFRALLAASARVTVLPFHHAPDPGPGYTAAGRHVVDNSDALIAIWDGVMSGKRAGTAATVAYAQAKSKPVHLLRFPGPAAPSPSEG